MIIIEKEFNAITGETTIIERDETVEETEQRLAAEAEAAAELAAYEAHKAARLAAEQKLAALGLTKEDLTALGL